MARNRIGRFSGPSGRQQAGPRRAGRRPGPSGRRSVPSAAGSARSRRAGRRWTARRRSSGGPSATTTPSRMTTIRSNRAAANSMSWVIAIDRCGRRPASPRRRRRRARCRRRPGRSSARRARGRPGPWPGRRPGRPACAATGRGRTGSSCAGSPSPTAARLPATRGAISAGGIPRLRGPNETSRSTLRSNSCSSGFWKTKPTVAASSAIGWPSVGSPSIRTRPSAGRSSPFRCLTRVVLPEPFWPRIATASPGSMVNETPRTASMPLG